MKFYIFSQEFDNDAETLVSSLAINNDDDELESGIPLENRCHNEIINYLIIILALKLTQVDMYTRRLRERSRRKRISRDFYLVPDFFVTLRKERPIQKKKTGRHEK
jgi:transcriptional adapter 2-beta